MPMPYSIGCDLVDHHITMYWQQKTCERATPIVASKVFIFYSAPTCMGDIYDATKYVELNHYQTAMAK